MEEFARSRVVAKRLPGAARTLLALDATIGQNAVQQAKIFAEAAGVGARRHEARRTARGGVVIAVHEAIDVPVKFLGVGEAAEDLGRSTRRRFRGCRAASERPPR
jgi:fused signal recognition particle receptor